MEKKSRDTDLCQRLSAHATFVTAVRVGGRASTGLNAGNAQNPKLCRGGTLAIRFVVVPVLD